MNAPEKKVFTLALLLFALGLLVKFSPWDPVPQIETFSYAEQAREESPKERPRLKKTETLPSKAKPREHFPLSINRASVSELCTIKGVGPKLAEKIVAYRTAHGRFSGPADLKKVSGIGKKKAEKILTFVIFD